MDAGYPVNEPMEIDGIHTQYVEDDQGFSVELNYVDEQRDSEVGFVPDAIQS
jgi:hypothetical protein